MSYAGSASPEDAYEASYGKEGRPMELLDFDGGGMIEGVQAQLAYILSGAKAGRRVRLTIRNTRTGRHLTYQVETARGPVSAGEGRRRFVSVPDNDGAYIYLGTIFDQGSERAWIAPGGHCQRYTRWHYYRGKKSTIAGKTMTAKAWLWLWGHMTANKELPANAQVWHEGRCGRCGRVLTDPESIKSGLGPVCARRAVC